VLVKKILFTKMNGAGNDFVILDKTKNKSISLSKQQISNICNRRKGIGADGVIIFSSSKNSDFSMEYFNADGSTGSLCGNGARCAIQYASDTTKLKDGNAVFQANNESFSGEVIKHGIIKLEMKLPKKLKLNFRIKASSQLIKSHYADTGSPHVVIEIEDVLALPKDLNSKYRNIQNFPVIEIGKEIRYHKDFAPEGTNVNFVQVKNEEVLIRTYERGVENETLACGTGAVASALVVSSLKNTSSPIKIKTWGGDELIIDFQKIGSRFEKISLTGPAKTVYSGEVDLDQF
jgi:diaminopimelate epimerase